MKDNFSISFFVQALVITAFYFLAAKLGLTLATINNNVSPVWPATGVAIACISVFGYRFLPSIFIGAFIANALTGSMLLTNLGIAFGNTLESAVAVWFLNSLISRKSIFHFESRAIAFLAASIFGSAISATVGVSSLFLSKILTVDQLGQLWVTWWIGDVLGALVVAPFLIRLLKQRDLSFLYGKWFEFILVFGLTLLLSFQLFKSPNGVSYLFALFPFILWSVVRLGGFESETLTFLISVVAIFETTYGVGPFQTGSLNDKLIFLQLFLASVSITVLFLNAFQELGEIRYQAISVLLVGWVLSGGLFYAFHIRAAEKDRFHFQSIVTTATKAIDYEIGVYHDALRAGAGLFYASEFVDQKEWKAFTDGTKIVERHPGLRGIGMIEVVKKSSKRDFLKSTRKMLGTEFNIQAVPDIPTQNRPVSDYSYVIKYIEPADANMKATGLDIASEENRFSAANLARDSGHAAITNPIVLVQDDQKRLGFLYLIPLYKNGMSINTIDERRKAIIGWVYAPFVLEAFINYAIDKSLKNELVYELEFNKNDVLSEKISSAEAVTSVSIGQKVWTFKWKRGPHFISEYDSTSAWTAFFGSLLTLLLVGFIISFQSIGIRAQQIADEKTSALIESESRFKALVNSSPMGVILAKIDGTLLEVNDAFLKMLGYTRTEFEYHGLSSETFNLHEYQEIDEKSILRLLTGKNVVPYEKEYVCKDGSRIPVLVGLSRIKETKDQLTVFVVDLRDRKKMEMELVEAKDAALAGMRVRSQFLATMSHEIRTPLNGIIGMSDLLLETNPSAGQLKYIKIVQESGQNLLSIVNDILDFSKIEANKLDFENVEFNPGSIVENQSDIMMPKVKSKELTLLTFIDPAVPQVVLGDSGRLSQILINLISNAIKFTEKGTIFISVAVDEVLESSIRLKFSVKDTGIGISRDKINSLFSPFTQADASTARKYGGTGLGLSICRKLVELMKGKIWIESKEGEGSTFYFTAEFGLPERKSEIEAPYFYEKNIIVLDDDPVASEILTVYLKSTGANIYFSDNLKVAEQHLQKLRSLNKKIDLAIVDRRLKNEDGLQFVDLMRNGYHMKDIPVVVITAFDRDIDEGFLSSKGIKHVLSKPFKRADLIAALQEILSMESKADETISLKTFSNRNSVGESLPKGRILVVEDNSANQILALTYLKQLGYSAQAVANGSEAVAAAQTGAFDIIFMDCQMPEMDGFEATRRIRTAEKGENKRVCIVALTANAMKEDKVACLAAGMDDYLSKPFKKNELLVMIEKWMERSATQTA